MGLPNQTKFCSLCCEINDVVIVTDDVKGLRRHLMQMRVPELGGEYSYGSGEQNEGVAIRVGGN